MAIVVVVWNNAGERREIAATTLADAHAVAKQSRTLANRTVKIADALGSVFHWSRATALARNHWSARAVADIACD